MYTYLLIHYDFSTIRRLSNSKYATKSDIFVIISAQAKEIKPLRLSLREYKKIYY